MQCPSGTVAGSPFILQKFVTYEGRYSHTFVYHFRMLQHFEATRNIQWRMNFPYFLLKSLEKMAKGVRDGQADQADKNLYHHNLIKLLVQKQLEVKGMTWEALLKQLHKKTVAGKETQDPTSTSKGPSKNVKGSPSCTSEKRKQPEKSKEERDPSPNKKTTSAPVEETPSMPPVQLQTPEEDNLSALADVAKFSEVEDDNLLADFIKNPRKKNKESSAGKEPQSPQDLQSPSAPVQEEEPEEEEPMQEEELQEEEPVQEEEP